MGKSLILALIMIIGCFTVIPADAQETWTKAGLQSIYTEHLRQEGYLPSIDDDGDIIFKVSGENYFIILNEDDLQFFQIYTGFSLDGISEEEALNAVNISNRHSKVAKVSFSSGRNIVSITAELLINNPRDFIPVFARALSLIRNAQRNFMNELASLKDSGINIGQL